MDKTYYLYKITNTLNQKLYIGQTLNPKRRWNDHKWLSQNKQEQYIHRAMAKYGVENFQFEIIATCETLEDANKLEVELIKQHDSRSKEKGYNLASGGKVIEHSPETIEKLKALWTDERKEQYSQQVTDIHAARTSEQKEKIANKISQTLMGHAVSNETSDKISKALTGKSSWSKGTKGIMKSNKTSFQIGHPAPETAFGKGHVPKNRKVSKEQIEECLNIGMSISQIAKKYSVGYTSVWYQCKVYKMDK